MLVKKRWVTVTSFQWVHIVSLYQAWPIKASYNSGAMEFFKRTSETKGVFKGKLPSNRELSSTCQTCVCGWWQVFLLLGHSLCKPDVRLMMMISPSVTVLKWKLFFFLYLPLHFFCSARDPDLSGRNNNKNNNKHSTGQFSLVQSMAINLISIQIKF